ncbi:DUF3775 domain-containing protein [Kineobactrum salinum]|uniref:DUF3775 domain-containing protein n=1 Tax=Kineobactrum salinum TaxID=2708301 RepID=A0A6C0U3Q7_9GAMM|nr:DUF3775 domain-containing protein [Kineobactrum salinum]QIB66483.1 DUF3775 domain-containing protein [Kineobactrum salinum]
MLEVNPDVICRLIEISRQLHGLDEPIVPEEDAPELEGSISLENSLDEDEQRAMLAGHGEQTAEQEFAAIVDELEPRQQQEVVAMMWLGRGDYLLTEWQEALDLARDEWTPDTASYLLGHPLLASHLQDGLEQHGYNCGELLAMGEP